jgi:hypothetical protein
MSTLLLLAPGGVSAATNAPIATESVNASVTSNPKYIFGLFNSFSLLSFHFTTYIFGNKEYDRFYALSLPLICIFFLIKQF